jgi:hypothetical protein
MARKKANIHYIYKTTCNVTGRWYIGMHSAYNLDDGYMGSGKMLRHSIRKYGIENHTKEILEFLPTREELVLREIEIVTKELFLDGLCMNLKEGGQGGFANKEHMIKCVTAGGQGLIDKMNTDEDFKMKILNTLVEARKKAHPDGKKYDNFKNKNHSDGTKQLMSEKRKGTGNGETNSQYGTCWITKEGSNKKIKKENLETYLNEGWLKGRK